MRSFIVARLGNSWSRPALIRCMSSVRPPASSISSFPRRRTPSIFAPSSALSGGSNVFSALIPGTTAVSIVSPASDSLERRAVISISGSSGIAHRR